MNGQMGSGASSYVKLFFWTLSPVLSPGLRLTQTGDPTDRLSVPLSPFLPEEGSRIQLPKHCSFIIV
jgi:hypothetical protein